MEDLPLVSICIPNYNNAQFIGEAIESSIAQTYPNLEIIVVDNVSTDNSWEIIQNYAQHKYVKVFLNEKNLGMVGNFRRTYEYSNGELITYLCSDDSLSKDAICENVAILRKYREASFVFGNVEYIGTRTGKSNLSFDELMFKGEWTKRSLEQSRNLTFLTGSIFRRNVAEKLEGSVIDNLSFFDWYLWLRLGILSVAFNSNTIGTHRYHAGNQTKLITPSIVENYIHLSEVLKAFKNLYPNRMDIAKAEHKLSFKFALLLVHQVGLKELLKFSRKYCSYSYISAIKIIFFYLFSSILKKIKAIKFKILRFNMFKN